MQTPRSKFVRDKIVGRRFPRTNLAYVEKLLQIERFVVDGVRSWGSSMVHRSLLEAYPTDYDAIERELRPGDFARRVRREKTDAELQHSLDRKLALREAAHAAKDRSVWLELGGIE